MYISPVQGRDVQEKVPREGALPSLAKLASTSTLQWPWRANKNPHFLFDSNSLRDACQIFRVEVPRLQTHQLYQHCHLVVSARYEIDTCQTQAPKKLSVFGIKNQESLNYCCLPNGSFLFCFSPLITSPTNPEDANHPYHQVPPNPIV